MKVEIIITSVYFFVSRNSGTLGYDGIESRRSVL